jgi:hypothetical protein
VGALAGSTIMLLTIPWFIGENCFNVDMQLESAMVGCVRFVPAPPFPTFDSSNGRCLKYGMTAMLPATIPTAVSLVYSSSSRAVLGPRAASRAKAHR